MRSGDGDGWVQCAAGHRHWGLFGAAGLLISDGSRAILQHRAPWTHEGDTWGLPGGARDSHEDPVSTALREAAEEAALPADAISASALWIDDHGGWSYTTVLAHPIAELYPHAANAESVDIRWWPLSAIESLPLHRGLAATWPHVRRPPAPLSIVVDAEIGAQLPLGRTTELARDGVRVSRLPPGIDGGALSLLLPRVVTLARDETDRADVVAAANVLASNGQVVLVSDRADWLSPAGQPSIGLAPHVVIAGSAWLDGIAPPFHS
jgi:8-oxo-dGTP diphosphatase